MKKIPYSIWMLVDGNSNCESYLQGETKYCMRVDEKGTHHLLGKIKGTQQEAMTLRVRLASEFRAKINNLRRNGFNYNPEVSK